MMAASNMFLFWGSGSIPCWKPMLVLEEKGLGGYGNKLISFSDKGHKGEDVMKLNPRGQVPTFKDGNVVVNESGAICQYLEQTYKQGTQLIPSNAAEAAQVYQRIYEAANIEQSLRKDLIQYMFRTKQEDKKQVTNVEGTLMRDLVYYVMFDPKSDKKEEVIKEKLEKARAELDIWEGYMKANGAGAFIAGKTFSMADVFFFPFFAFGVRLGLDLTKFPALAEYYNRVKDRDSVKKTWPPHWTKEASKADFLKDL